MHGPPPSIMAMEADHSSLPLAADKTFLLMHTYVDNGHYAIAVVVRDSGGLIGTGTLPVNVQNVAPQHLSFAGPEFAAQWSDASICRRI